MMKLTITATESTPECPGDYTVVAGEIEAPGRIIGGILRAIGGEIEAAVVDTPVAF